MTEKANIPIPKKLKQKIEKKIKDTNFKSVSEYITFVLEKIISETKTEKQAYTKEEEKDIAGAQIFTEDDDYDAQGYTKEEEEDLKKSLEDQGYI